MYKQKIWKQTGRLVCSLLLPHFGGTVCGYWGLWQDEVCPAHILAAQSDSGFPQQLHPSSRKPRGASSAGGVGLQKPVTVNLSP